MRENVTLECQQCKSQNYRTSRERSQGKRLQLRKYCPKCRKHTVHRERR